MIDGEEYLCIRHMDRMPAFLMSVASDSDFWLFVGSNGGFTAGRVDPDHAISPYQTADKILSLPKASGVLSLMVSGGISWEPWDGLCPQHGITRNLYKHVTGTSVLFESMIAIFLNASTADGYNPYRITRAGIDWHMVAKLLLAVQEIHLQAVREHPDAAGTLLLGHAYDGIRNGLGFTKNSSNYGAFPTDPYSHSPRHRGAQQPGMTGQVKEEILTRMGELGVNTESGCVCFAPVLLKRSEFFTAPHAFAYIDIHGHARTWNLGPDTLAFTAFQVLFQMGVRSGH